jgi:hypothetical protein
VRWLRRQRQVDHQGVDLAKAMALSFHWRAAANADSGLAAARLAEPLARSAHAYEEAARQAEAAVTLWEQAVQHRTVSG